MEKNEIQEKVKESIDRVIDEINKKDGKRIQAITGVVLFTIRDEGDEPSDPILSQLEEVDFEKDIYQNMKAIEVVSANFMMGTARSLDILPLCSSFEASLNSLIKHVEENMNIDRQRLTTFIQSANRDGNSENSNS